MNSGYIESKKILARKDIVEWLDGCGVVWAASRHTFAAFTNITQPFIEYVKPWDGFVQCDEPFTDSTHYQTPEQFCELIAESLGIDKPVFGELGNVTFDAKKYIPVDEPTISKTETVETIKGMAIEVSRLSKDERNVLIEWLPYYAETMIGMASRNENGVNHVGYGDSFGWATKDWYQNKGYTITDSPKVFMEYVAQQTGKEYIRKLEITPEIRDKIQAKIKDRLAPPSYPHKTYRILDSLDGIPLDTRFKLSEFPLPPFGKSVMFIILKDRLAWAKITGIHNGGICIQHMMDGSEDMIDLDGEWMRIV